MLSSDFLVSMLTTQRFAVGLWATGYIITDSEGEMGILVCSVDLGVLSVIEVVLNVKKAPEISLGSCILTILCNEKPSILPLRDNPHTAVAA